MLELSKSLSQYEPGLRERCSRLAEKARDAVQAAERVDDLFEGAAPSSFDGSEAGPSVPALSARDAL